ncbi:MAG: LysR family transcriptional regulator [Desulfovibrio sp.]|jgi:molybdate transport system regulatory protein|nr:LysR family transcriptional regulator [Desulfovibrio sp.]
MTLTMKLFIAKNEDYILGSGRIQLLKSIRELGSLRQAANLAGMSYRWAWARLTKMEKALGFQLLVRGMRGKKRVAALTPEADAIVDWYGEAEQEIGKLLIHLEARMPAPLKEALETG